MTTNHISHRWGRAAAVLGATLAIAVPAGAASAHAGTALSGVGTPTIDGIIAPGEWDSAGSVGFTARLPSNDGGGTTAGTLFVMNDAANLYLAIRVARVGEPRGSFVVEFDNDHDGVFLEDGDDAFVANPGSRYADDFRTTQPPCPAGFVCGLMDSEVGGTSDGQSASGGSNGTIVYEVSKPLDSADDLHDFSLKPGDSIGFGANVQIWSLAPSCNFGSQCVEDTLIVNGGDIRVAGRDTTPPVIATPGDLLPDATSPGGASVVYTVSATDDVDGTVSASCSPTSGSLFAIGTSTVTCTASDSAGNVATGSFTIHVRGASEQLDTLAALVSLDSGPGVSLTSKLDAVRDVFARDRRTESCAILAAFDHEVEAQTDKSISSYIAGEARARAARIQAVVGC